MNSASYDANGNQGSASQCDVENRLANYSNGGPTYYYGYDGANKRVAKSASVGVNGSGNPIGTETLMFYGVGGERLAEFTLTMPVTPPSGWYLRFAETKTLVWFGSKLLRDGKYAVVQDRLGSVRWRYDTVAGTSSTADYYPYGQEKPSATTDDREKFATYLRDAESGLDYADQRYHNPGWGRFLTADVGPTTATNPASWNRYTYAWNDPVNLNDRNGMTPMTLTEDYGFTYTSFTQYVGFDREGNLLEPIVHNVQIGVPRAGVGARETYSSFAKELSEMVKKGDLTDCDALAVYADEMARVFDGNLAGFLKSFSAFVPSGQSNQPFGKLAGVWAAPWGSAERLESPDYPSGYKMEYQNGYNENVLGDVTDQSHHFSAYIQLGASVGIIVGSLYAIGGEFGNTNEGDKNLGLAAVGYGAALASGDLDPKELGNRIRRDLCRK